MPISAISLLSGSIHLSTNSFMEDIPMLSYVLLRYIIGMEVASVHLSPRLTIMSAFSSAAVLDYASRLQTVKVSLRQVFEAANILIILVSVFRW